jgi:diaminopimelate dehydrogenase
VKIRIGIAGYGNIGRGVEKALGLCPDMELTAVFTRREPESIALLTQGVPVCPLGDAEKFKDKIDVMILCGGSSKDLPEQGPALAAMFNTVDSFDVHAKIPEYFGHMDESAKKTAAIISVGWDPGLFSVMRALGAAVLPQGASYTFWGRGVSQGHSFALRRIEGVLDAIQYTVPKLDALDAVRGGENPNLTVRDKHLRECYVVAAENADLAKIEREIRTMPDYFADYDVLVHFISMEEMREKHAKMPHAGFVFRSGSTGDNAQVIEYSLKLSSNPEFTASVLVAYARAAARLAREGNFGAKTVLDVPPAYLSPKDGAELRKTLV